MSSIDRYLPYINNAIAQKGQARANQFRQGGADISQLLQALSQIAQANATKTEGADLFRGAIGESTTKSPLGTTTENYIDPVGTRDLVSSGNPVAQQMFNTFLTAQKAQRPEWEQLNPAMDRTQVNPMAKDYGKTFMGQPKPLAPKKIGQATEKGRMVATMSDGSKVDLGESFEGTRLGLAKQNLELAKQRINAFKDEKLKSEGKYLLDKWTDTEKQYNKNALYLSDANLAESTRQAILAEQDGLAEKMMGYTASIEALGTTVNDVVAQPRPNPSPKPKPAESGKIKVKRKSDGKTGTIEAKDFNAEKYDKI